MKRIRYSGKSLKQDETDQKNLKYARYETELNRMKR